MIRPPKHTPVSHPPTAAPVVESPDLPPPTFGPDESARQQTEETLRESQAFYHSLVNQLPAGVFRKDQAGRFVFVGMQAEDLLGKTSRIAGDSEVAKRDPTGRAAKYANAGVDHHELIMATGKSIEQVEEYVTDEGRPQFIHVIKFPVVDPAGKIIGTQGILFDITARLQTEASKCIPLYATRCLNPCEGKAVRVEMVNSRLASFSPEAR